MPAIFRPFSELARLDIHIRNLPHWDIPGATYFVTFRTADALPAGAVQKLQIELESWLRTHGLEERSEVHRLSNEARLEFRKRFTIREEQWFDAGYGTCALRSFGCREFVVETLHAFDGTRYALDDYVIMPNHVHVVLQPLYAWKRSDILASWKKFSARRINEICGESGTFWQKESFDHIIRDRDRLDRARIYIAENPAKARLKTGEYHLGRGTRVH